jgi:hypothetical protein
MEKHYQDNNTITVEFNNLDNALAHILASNNLKIIGDPLTPYLSYNLDAGCEAGKIIINYTPTLFINLDNITSATLEEKIRRYFVNNKIIGITVPDKLIFYGQDIEAITGRILYGYHSINMDLNIYEYLVNTSFQNAKYTILEKNPITFKKKDMDIWIKNYTFAKPPPDGPPPPSGPPPPGGPSPPPPGGPSPPPPGGPHPPPPGGPLPPPPPGGLPPLPPPKAPFKPSMSKSSAQTPSVKPALSFADVMSQITQGKKLTPVGQSLSKGTPAAIVPKSAPQLSIAQLAMGQLGSLKKTNFDLTQ